MTATIETTEVGTVNLLDVLTAGRTLPDGYDEWAVRTVRSDLRSSRGYRYPFPGQVAKAAGPFRDHSGECPEMVGDGICAATTWQGMASGGVSARTLLLVAYKKADVLGGSRSAKLRLREFMVVDLVDGERLLVNSGRYANLGSADLGYANLGYADLRYADLRSANLRYADLRSANLGYANLGSADLGSANLRYANLGSADLRSANLRYANLRYANLRSADLRYANLRSANLRSADLRLTVGLTGEQLRYSYVDEWTQLPSGLVIPS